MNEYLDDPLADNNDDAINLRGAVNRAVRKRHNRGKPYSYTGQARRQNAFSANDFFCGFSQTFAPGVFKTFKPSDYASGQQAFYDRTCFFCRQTEHYVRDCPFARGQQVPAPTLTLRSHRPQHTQVASRRGDQVEYSDNVVILMNMSLMQIQLFL